MMNKKKFVLLLIFLWSIFWIATNYSYWAEEYKETDMKNITISFCDESTTQGAAYVEPGKEKNLCLYIANGWEKKMTFEYGFTMGWFSKAWDRVCDADMSTGNTFSMLIPQTSSRTITINPMTWKTIEEKIVIPPGMSGTQLGCLVYKLAKPEFDNLAWWMFTLEIHKSVYLDIVVWWESTAKSSIKLLRNAWGIFSTNSNIKAVVDKENNLTLSFLVENQGNIWQSVTITGKIYNALGFQKDFAITTNTVAPGSKNEFKADAGILPAYKWFFTVKLYVKGDPQFMFPIANEKLKQPIYITEQGQIFQFSRMVVIILIIILLVLYKLFVPRRIRSVK